MITAGQSRAARAFLNWTLDDLARASGLSRTSLNTFEQGVSNAKAETYRLIQDAFERAGIEFTAEPGVRMRGQRLEVRRWEGDTIIEQLLDDIFETCRVEGGEVLFSGLNENMFENVANSQKLLQKQIERLRKYEIKERVILREGDDHFSFPIDITTYRWIAPEFFSPVPCIIYGNKHALFVFTSPLTMIVTESSQIAQMYRKQFELFWSLSKPVPFSEQDLLQRYQNLYIDA